MTSLADHFDSHIQQNSHLCDICAKTFLTKKQLGDHMRRHTYSVTCDVCYKSYSSNTALKLHAMTHTGEKPNSCEYCGRSFTSRCNLKSHIRSHLGEKPFKCTLCDYRAVQSTSIKKHMIASHSDVRAFACHLCSKTFKFKSQLTMHVRRHLGDKRHVCDVCNMGFVDTSTLKEHKVTHTDARPHVCDICAQTFRRRDKLNLHLRTTHAVDTRKFSGYVGLSKDRQKPAVLVPQLPDVTDIAPAPVAVLGSIAAIDASPCSTAAGPTTPVTSDVTASAYVSSSAGTVGSTNVLATLTPAVTSAAAIPVTSIQIPLGIVPPPPLAQPQFLTNAVNHIAPMQAAPNMSAFAGQAPSDGYNQMMQHWSFMSPHHLPPPPPQ